MAITQGVVIRFKEDVLRKVHNLESDSLKIALYTSLASLSNGTKQYITSAEVTAASSSLYTAGGKPLVANVTIIGSTAVVDFADVSWSSATFTARGAYIYNDTHTSNAGIAVLNFGSDKTATNGTFTIQFPALTQTTALIRLL